MFENEHKLTFFQEGYNYKKSGVYVTGITPASGYQNVVFHPADRERNQKIMQIMDEVNKKWGRNKTSCYGLPKARLAPLIAESYLPGILPNGMNYWK